MSRSTPNQMMHLKDEDGEKSCPQDLEHWILVRRGQHRRLKSPFLIKNDDPGVLSIECTINGYSFQKTLYDTGSDVNGRSHLSAPAWNHAPTTNIHSAPDDFQVIDMGEDEYDPPIILGKPFLNTIKAIIYNGTGEVHMHFSSEKVRHYFTNLNYIVNTLSRPEQEEDDATATRGGKSSRTDGQTTKEKW